MKITVEVTIEPDFVRTDGIAEGVGMRAATERVYIGVKNVPAETWKAVCDVTETVAGAYDPEREAFDPLAQFGDSMPDK